MELPPVTAGKTDWRRYFAARCRSVSGEDARAAGDAVAEGFQEVEAARAPQRVALYASLPDELPLEALVSRLVGRGTPLLWPRICGGVLEFAACDPQERRPGAFGILEPPEDRAAQRLGDGDLVVVPGRGFDHSGVRLGRGRGFYDRFLERYPAPFALGVGYEFQRVPKLPSEPHDVPLDALLTECRVYRPGR